MALPKLQQTITARAMNQPPSTAAPTVGPYYVHLPGGADEGCRTIRTEKGRTRGGYHGTEIAYTVGLGNDAEDKANANLLAASWETAAERDRLVAVNEKLVKALKNLVFQVRDASRCTTEMQFNLISMSVERADAVLDEAGQR